MPTNYPGSLDDDSTLPDDPLVEDVSSGHLAHHPSVHGAARALETKLGVGNSDAASAATGQAIRKQGGGGTAWADIFNQTIAKAAVSVTQRPLFNFVDGSNVTIAVTDDGANNRTNIQIAASTGGGGGTMPVTKLIKASNSIGAYPNADYVCDGTNDHVEIQAAIDAINAGTWKTGRILLTEGTFNVAAAIKLRTGISIHGLGVGATQIKSVGTDGGTVPAMVRLVDADVHMTELAYLMLDGNFTAGGNVNGIWYDNNGGTFSAHPNTHPDPVHWLHHLFLYGTGSSAANRDGIYCSNAAGTATGNARGSFFHDLYIQQPGRDCINWDAPDTDFTNITGRDGRRYGAHIRGGNNKLTGCKMYFNDDAGYFIASARNQLANCQSQDSGGHGFDVSAANTILSGCQADSNGRLFATTTRAAGFRFGASRAVAVGCHSFDRGQTPTSPQREGYNFASGSDTICIGSADANSVAPWTGNMSAQQIVVITSPQGDLFRQNIGRPFFAVLNSAPTDGDIGNSQMSVWGNEGTDQLTFRWRDSTGTLFTKTL